MFANSLTVAAVNFTISPRYTCNYDFVSIPPPSPLTKAAATAATLQCTLVFCNAKSSANFKQRNMYKCTTEKHLPLQAPKFAKIFDLKFFTVSFWIENWNKHTEALVSTRFVNFKRIGSSLLQLYWESVGRDLVILVWTLEIIHNNNKTSHWGHASAILRRTLPMMMMMNKTKTLVSSPSLKFKGHLKSFGSTAGIHAVPVLHLLGSQTIFWYAFAGNLMSTGVGSVTAFELDPPTFLFWKMNRSSPLCFSFRKGLLQMWYQNAAFNIASPCPVLLHTSKWIFPAAREGPMQPSLP